MKFSSTEDLDDIDALNSKNTTNLKEDDKNEEGKSYTNTVNSKEFREYLNKHGLVLFPVKTSTDGAETKEPVNLKKKTMMKRLSSMFARSKMPYSAENEKRFVADEKSDNSKFFYATPRTNYGKKNNASVAFSKIRPGSRTVDIDDCKSSISSILSAADTEDYLSSPICVTRKTKTSAPSATKPFQRNLLYQTMPSSYYRSKIPIPAINSLKPLDKQKNHDRNNLPLRRSVPTNYRQYVQSPIDPFTFAKIHQIQRHTDENFRRDSSQFEPDYYKIPQQILNDNRKIMAEPPVKVVLRNGEYQKNLNNYKSPRSSIASPNREVSREEVMDKIYEYYRKSVNNTPVPTNVKDSFYSTLPSRPTKVYQANGFARISNPIQNQQKIYDEVHHSSRTPTLYQDRVRPNNNQAVYGNLRPLNVLPATSTPVNDKKPNQFSPKKINLSQKGTLYSSQVFRPIAELCSRIFTDPRTPRKSKHQTDAQFSNGNNNGRSQLF